MIPAVGKSGAGTMAMSSSMSIAGLPRTAMQASTTSFRLCGGMFVAIPTAMPEEPFTSRFGSRAGRMRGSDSLPS